MKTEQKKKLIVMAGVTIIAIIIIAIVSIAGNKKGKANSDIVSDNGKTIEMKS